MRVTKYRMEWRVVEGEGEMPTPERDFRAIAPPWTCDHWCLARRKSTFFALFRNPFVWFEESDQRLRSVRAVAKRHQIDPSLHRPCSQLQLPLGFAHGTSLPLRVPAGAASTISIIPLDRGCPTSASRCKRSQSSLSLVGMR